MAADFEPPYPRSIYCYNTLSTTSHDVALNCTYVFLFCCDVCDCMAQFPTDGLEWRTAEDFEADTMDPAFDELMVVAARRLVRIRAPSLAVDSIY